MLAVIPFPAPRRLVRGGHALALAALLWATPLPASTLAFLPCPASDVVRVVDVTARRVIADLPVGGGPEAVIVSPDGSRAYVSRAREAAVAVVDASSLSVAADIALPGPGRVLAVSPDGGRLVVASLDGKEIWFIDTAAGRPLSQVGGFARIEALLFTGDGSRAVAVDRAGRVALLEGGRGTPGASVAAGPSITCAALSPDGVHLYLGRSGLSGLDVFDLSPLKQAGSIRLPRPAAALAVEHGGLLLVLHGGGSVSRVNPRTKEVASVGPEPGGLLAILPGGCWPPSSAPEGRLGLPLQAALVPPVPPPAPPAAESFLASLEDSARAPGSAREAVPKPTPAQAAAPSPPPAPPPSGPSGGTSSPLPEALMSGGQGQTFSTGQAPQTALRLPGSQESVPRAGGSAPGALYGTVATGPEAPAAESSADEGSPTRGAGAEAPAARGKGGHGARPPERTTFYWFWPDASLLCPPQKVGAEGPDR